MSVGDPLAGCIAKVERAEVHFNALYPKINAFLQAEPKPYRLIPEVDVESSRYLWRLHVVEEPPLEWSTVLGDYLQNLRAALDHLIWILVRANGQSPSGGNAFPIFDQSPPNKRGHGEREKWERNTRGLHPAAIHLVELCQPYKGPNGPSVHTLAGLRRLSNEDKHRTLLPAFIAIDQDKPMVFKGMEVRDIKPTVEGIQIRAGRPLEENDIALEMAIEISGPNPEAKQGDLSLDVGFGRKPIPLKGLQQMSETVVMILLRARGLLGE